MSALGVVPGFGYPRLDWQGAEYYATSPRIVVPGGGGSVVADLAPSVAGMALYIDDVLINLIASAAVGNRIAAIGIQDPDGNFISFNSNPLAIPAGQFMNWQWSQKLSSAFSLNGNGYAPMQNAVILPGFALATVIQGLDGADKVNGVFVTGRAIPTMGEGAAEILPLPTPLLA